jgi:hypothetical protein
MALNRLRPPREYNDEETGQAIRVETIVVRPGETLAQWETKEKRHGRTPKHVQLKISQKAQKRLMALSDIEFRTIMMMCVHAGWESNVVTGDGLCGRPGEPMTWPEIERMMCMSRNTRYKVQKLFERKRIVGYIEVDGEHRGIVIHPDFVQYGGKITEDFRKVFDNKETIDPDSD